MITCHGDQSYKNDVNNNCHQRKYTPFGGNFKYTILFDAYHKKIDICKCLSLLWSCYFILHFTVFDYPIGGKIASYMFENYSSVPELFRHFNFIPFHTIGECIDSGLQTFIRQVFGNIILFVPLGITVSWIFEQKSFRYRMYFIVTISVLIEITQLFLDLCSGMVVKSVDVDDILLNEKINPPARRGRIE